MYTYTFSDDETDEISAKTKKSSELEKLFGDIDAKYNMSSINKEDYEKSLDLQKQKFEAKSSEEIEKEAENSLYDYSKSKDAIENDYTEKETAIDEDLKETKKSAISSKESLKSAYEEVKMDAENDAIKRGLARSSIIVNKLAKYDESMLSKFAEIEKDYAETTNKLTSQKNLLLAQKQNALDSFDIAYAIKLSDKINSITQQLQEKEKEVMEYNNKMEQLEKQYNLDMLKQYASDLSKVKQDNLDYMEFVSKYGENGVETLKAKEKYNLAYEHLMSLGKEEAMLELENNPIYKEQLKGNYETLIHKMKSR